MGTYEVLFIISPDVPEEDVTTLIGEFRGIAEDAGAKLIEEDAWGRRKLAYPIDKRENGVYHLFIFEAGTQDLSELDRRMKNNDRIMRHMIVRTDLETRRAKKLGAIQEEKAAAKASKAARRAPKAEEGATATATAPAPARETVTEGGEE